MKTSKEAFRDAIMSTIGNNEVLKDKIIISAAPTNFKTTEKTTKTVDKSVVKPVEKSAKELVNELAEKVTKKKTSKKKLIDNNNTLFADDETPKTTKSVKKETSTKDTTSTKKLPLVSKKKKEENKVVLPKQYNELFPSYFNVFGVEFKRLDIDALKTNENDYVEIITDVFNKLSEDDNKALVIGVNWNLDMCQSTKRKASYYAQCCAGFEAPQVGFPCNLDMHLIDAILPFSARAFSIHSIYNEFSSTIPFNSMKKRTNYQFTCNNAPFEFYIADYTNADENHVIGSFIDILDSDNATK